MITVNSKDVSELFSTKEMKTILNWKTEAYHFLDQRFGSFADSIFLGGDTFGHWYHGVEPPIFDLYIFHCADDRMFNNVFAQVKGYLPDIVNTGFIASKSIPLLRDVVISSAKSVRIHFCKTTDRHELLKDIDFLSCTPMYGGPERKMYLTRAAFDAIVDKKLIAYADRIKNGTHGLNPSRIAYYQNLGWTYDGV